MMELAGDVLVEVVAARLGLRRAGHSACGVVEGAPVEIRARPDGVLAILGLLDPPLDLGLEIETQGWNDDVLGEWLGPRDVQVGDPGFDALFAVRGDDEDRVRALVTAGVREALHRVNERDWTFHVGDGGVHLGGQYIGELDERAAWLEDAARAAGRVAAAMEAARPSLGPASALAPAHAVWREFAEPRGLRVGAAPLSIEGDLDGLAVSARALRTDVREYRVDAELVPPWRMGLGVRVERAGLGDAIASLFGGDVRLGDAPFDRRFRVRTDDGPRLGRLLDAEARAALVELDARVGALALVEERLTFGAVGADHHLVPGLLEGARRILARIGENLRGAPPSGPYR